MQKYYLTKLTPYIRSQKVPKKAGKNSKTKELLNQNAN